MHGEKTPGTRVPISPTPTTKRVVGWRVHNRNFWSRGSLRDGSGSFFSLHRVTPESGFVERHCRDPLVTVERRSGVTSRRVGVETPGEVFPRLVGVQGVKHKVPES